MYYRPSGLGTRRPLQYLHSITNSIST
ncbi:MAG: hypothetical protein J07HR59_00864 [Halorubrum sp. J07HR59]|nr:MAG: hypothetical protein J07HR59_00864 [Halorubrum sp. J07HR59]